MHKIFSEKRAFRGIAALLAAVMLAVMLPASVFAAEPAADSFWQTLAEAGQTQKPAGSGNREARNPDIAAAIPPEAGPLSDPAPVKTIWISETYGSGVEIPFDATGAAAQGAGWSWNAASKTLTVTGNLYDVYFYSDTPESATLKYSANVTVVGVGGYYVDLTVEGTGKSGATLTAAYVETYDADLTVQNAKIDIKSLDGDSCSEEVAAIDRDGEPNQNLTIKSSTITLYGPGATDTFYFGDYVYSDGSAAITDSLITATGIEASIYSDTAMEIKNSVINIAGDDSGISAGEGLNIKDSAVNVEGEGAGIGSAGGLNIADSAVSAKGSRGGGIYSIIINFDGDILIEGKSDVRVQHGLAAYYGSLTVNLSYGGRVEVGDETGPGSALFCLNTTNAKKITLGKDVEITEPADGKIDVIEIGVGQYVTSVMTVISGSVNLAPHVVFENKTYPARPGWNPFADVAADAWYYNSIKFIYEHRIFSGISATSFDPGAKMSRAMLVTVLWNYEGTPEPAKKTSFTDVSADAWYAKAVAWAGEIGIVSGIGDNKYAPDREVSRQDFVLILSKYAAYRGVSLPVLRPYAAFADQAGIAAYAKAAVETIYRAKIISGRPDGTFDPTGGASRAEVASMLHQFALIADAQ
ncbi:MAG: S-layer homology domain-containing protein [Oscillospiraceae bacterium]|jgi:hypothetical protein|nr:S-layer homology domain-containing protein [Oscillospiraceae bacterium]